MCFSFCVHILVSEYCTHTRVCVFVSVCIQPLIHVTGEETEIQNQELTHQTLNDQEAGSKFHLQIPGFAFPFHRTSLFWELLQCSLYSANGDGSLTLMLVISQSVQLHNVE